MSEQEDFHDIVQDVTEDVDAYLKELVSTKTNKSSTRLFVAAAAVTTILVSIIDYVDELDPETAEQMRKHTVCQVFNVDTMEQ